MLNQQAELQLDKTNQNHYESEQAFEDDMSATAKDLKTETDPLPVKKESHAPSSYRPDIDGLRTIAVGIVVIFHAWPDSLSGGFIGVDVFFVISGYLITQILVKQNIKGSFSYYNFYNRRVKRIYPALIVVLLLVLFLAVQYSQQQHLEMTTKTMAASTLFGANIEILTYKEGYFDADVKTNPLLHLWSLGVEEQFYIFWPFLILLLMTRFSTRCFQLLSAYAVLSFLLNIVVVYLSAKFDFYFPFCRFWQMAIGGLLAFRAFRINNLFYAHALSATALIVIVMASFFLSEANLYPGWWALFPTLAATAIILSGSESIVNKHLLSNPAMVFVGKISYSLYLWHWPLLVFSRLLYPEGSESILSQTWFIVLLSVAMSLLSYYFVENPLRFRKEKSVFVGLLLVMLLIGVASVAVYSNAEKIKAAEDEDFEEQLSGQEAEDSQQVTSGMLPTQQQSLIIENNAPSESQKRQTQNTENIMKDTQPKPQKTHIKKQILSQYQYKLDMIPTEQDFYVKKGKKIPNWSKSQNRQAPTVKKLKIVNSRRPWQSLLFDRPVTKISKYYRSNRPRKLKQFQVANEGQQKMVLLVGDSHSHYTAFRFGKLYEDAKKMNRTNQLPTFVAMLFQGTVLTKFDPSYKFIVTFIDQFKPSRVMFVYYWIHYNVYHGWENYQKNRLKMSDQYFYENIGYFLEVVKNCTDNGIEVTTNTFQPTNIQYTTSKMIGIDGIVKKNTQSFKLDEVTKAQRHLADYLEAGVKKAGGTVIDFTDHTCWNNTCEVLTPKGYSVFYDSNHWTFEASRNWLTSVDFFIQFDKQKK